MNISLLLPSRGRPAQLQRLFDSIVATTANIEKLEIILYIDEDDLPTEKVSHPSLSLIKLVKRPGERMGRMNQLCYEASQGRYVMLMNDDVVFRTPRWDERVVEVFTRYPDDVALVYGNDLYQRGKLPTMPVISRKACELIGGVCPADYFNTYIDLHLHDVFKKLAKVGHNRIVYLENVIFEHAHHDAGKSVMDATYVKRNEQADDLLFITLESDRWSQAKALGRHIGERRAIAPDGDPTKYRGVGVLKRWFASLLPRDKV